jgi:outer membrane biogenesis lipoprotein LolB
MRRFVAGCGIAGAALLAGCATVQPSTLLPATNLSPAAHFELSARLSVRVGDRLDVGNIKWSRLPAIERLGVYTPFGSQVAALEKSAAGVIVRKGDEVFRSASVGELTTTLLGVSLDLDEVARWVQSVGLTADETREQRLSDGTVWQVTCSGLRESAGQLYASRLSAVNGDTVVKLVIDEWRPL